VVAVVLVIKNWSKITDWFGQKWTQFTEWISEAWNNVVKWFTDFDFKQLFMDIGQSILSFLLAPLRLTLQLLAKIPGKIGDIAQTGLDTIDKFTGNVKVIPGDEESESDAKETLPSTTQASNQNLSRTITENNSNISLDIIDKGNNV